MIIGVGCIASDQILVTNVKWKDEKGKIIRRENRFGGNVRNSLVAISALGIQTAYVGTMSDEPKWQSAIDDFKSNGVSIEFVDYDAKSHPAEATIIITGDGDRFIVYDDEPLHHIKLPKISKVEKAISQAQLLMVDAGICPPGTLEIVKKCIENKIPVVLDAEQFFIEKSIILQMIDCVSDPVLPINFAKKVTGKEEVSEIINTLWNDSRNAVVITDGANGCYFRDASSPAIRKLSAYKITAVDTNGTGDIFHGAYAYGILNNMNTMERLKFASAAAASVAELPQGSVRKPNLERIKEFISSHSELEISNI